MGEDYEESNILDIISEAKKNMEARKIPPEYKKIKSLLSNVENLPSGMKLNTFQRIKILNNFQSLKISRVLDSWIKIRKNNNTIEKKLSSELHIDKNKKIKIHQLVPVLAPRDAVGNEILAIRNSLRDLGYVSEIYVEKVHPEMAHESKNYFSLKGPLDSDILIYHFATRSELVNEILKNNAKLIIIFHNTTPEKYFSGINDIEVESIREARQQLKNLKDRASLIIVHSDFSLKELQQEGFSNIITLPVLIDFSQYDVAADNDLLKNYKNSINILFVGRIVPHKKIENLLKIFGYYKTCINSNSNLFIIGGYSGGKKYFHWLQDLVKRTKLENVKFVSKLDFKGLVSYYKLADVFVTMSEHEGFGVPLVESMRFEVPIIAYNGSATPNTLNGAGILINKENPEEIGEIINLIVNDEKIKKKIIEKQKERLEYFNSNKIISQLRKQIEALL